MERVSIGILRRDSLPMIAPPRAMRSLPPPLVLLMILSPPQLAQASSCPSNRIQEWIDFDTEESACKITVSDAGEYELIFSDEFELVNRTFADGQDARWTALDEPPSTAHQINYYKGDLPRTQGGMLEIPVLSQDTDFDTSPTQNMSQRRHFQSGMVQSWNKFCFRQGYLEYAAIMPGRPDRYGLWPAFWMMGNLGRATVSTGSDGTWPFSFDECVDTSDIEACDVASCEAQRVSKCDTDPGYGLRPYQGRGAPEIDVVELRPGGVSGTQDTYKYTCDDGRAYNSTLSAAFSLEYPILFTTLVMAPGIPISADQAPVAGCIPLDGQWYPMSAAYLDGSGPFHFEGAAPSTEYVVQNGWGYYQTHFDGAWEVDGQPQPFTREVLAAMTTLDVDAFNTPKTYGLEWKAGPGGFVRWYHEGHLVYEIVETMLSKPRHITRDGGNAWGTLPRRALPEEPMYILLNVDISPDWGWPNHYPGSSECGPVCDCSCVSCQNPLCRHCVDPQGRNLWAWYDDFCEQIENETAYRVDYVRAYQPREAVQVGCDPPEYPTAQFIADQPERYTAFGSEVPLLGVAPGWGPCTTNAECGSQHNGTARGACQSGICVCEHDWTGPRCMSQTAGAAKDCRDTEMAAIDAYLGSAARTDLSHCLPSRKYNVTMLEMLVGLACTSKYGPRMFLPASAEPICRQINASYRPPSHDDLALPPLWQCSAYARAHAVLQAISDAEGVCCNALAFLPDGTPLLQCTGSALSLALLNCLWAVAWVLVGVVFLVVLYCIGRECRRADTRHDADLKRADDGARIALTVDMGRPEESHAELARVLLTACSAEARKQRATMMARLSTLFGFQPASCEAQQRHLESLLLSHLSLTSGDHDAAVRCLHHALLAPARRYKVHTSGMRGSGTRSKVRHGTAGSSDSTAWERPPADALLEEVALYLLLWAEAAQLRFMPELVLFLHALALDSVRHEDAAGAGAPPRAAEATFFEGVVRPVYEIVFSETFEGVVNNRPKPRAPGEMPAQPMNYDDWNEAFWSLSTLQTLRTTEGVSLMAAAPSQRWALLLRADWAAFFRQSGKTFVEIRWWYNLLGSHRRIFLLHLMVLYLCAVLYVVNRGPPTAPMTADDSLGANALSSDGFSFWATLAMGYDFSWNLVASDSGETDDYGWVLLMYPLLVLPNLSHFLGGLWAAWAVPGSSASFLGLLRSDAKTIAACKALYCLMIMVISFVVVFSSLPLISGGEITLRYPLVSGHASCMLLWLVAMCNWSVVTMEEFMPERTPSEAFDTLLKFEEHARTKDFLPMWLFWAIVFALKVAVTLTITLPGVFAANTVINQAFQVRVYEDLRQHSTWEGLLFLRVPFLMQLLLTYGLIGLLLLCCLAETLLLYTIVLSLWAGAESIFASCGRVGVGAGRCAAGEGRRHDGDAMRKLALAKGIAPSSAAWDAITAAIFDELLELHLLSQEEHAALAHDFGNVTATLPRHLEARRRLEQFASSLASTRMPTSDGVLCMPSLTVLVPHYAETIILPSPNFAASAESPNSDGANSHGSGGSNCNGSVHGAHVGGSTHSASTVGTSSDVPAPVRHIMRKYRLRELPALSLGGSASHLSCWKFLIEYHGDEWDRMTERACAELEAAPALTAAQEDLMLRQWASLRLQTLYRTLVGMMKNRRAIAMLLRASLPNLDEAELETLVDSKYQLLAAVQRYAVMAADELADIEVLLAQFPTLDIAYVDEVDVGGQRRYFSCLIDGHCPIDEATGRRRPLYRVELPGHPILGNGKGDNQNCAIGYSRGTILQAIDSNQDQYLEEAFKLPNALSEFRKSHLDGRGPAIVGFAEHIFSAIGSLGDFAASAELSFGVVIQSMMASRLHSRYHYGHPDVLDKLVMMNQGGVSKATRTLNLSEDIYAGMDAVLRGASVIHRDYFVVGKGRDMGFLSILSFCTKASGTSPSPSLPRPTPAPLSCLPRPIPPARCHGSLAPCAAAAS